MRKVTCLLFAVLMLATAVLALDPGCAYTTTSVRLRHNPSLTGEALRVVPKSSPVEVGICEGGLCEIDYHGESGYVAERTLTASVPLIPTGCGYINSQGERVRSPVHTADNRPPTGATAHCRNGTYSFSRSRRGTCSHHGSVAEWL